MTETGFDWRRLTSTAPETEAPTNVSSIPTRPLVRWLAIAGLIAAAAMTSVILALSTPKPTIMVAGDVTAAGGEAGSAGAPEPGSPVAGGPGGAVASAVAMVVVDVDGAVLRPGLVSLPLGSRVGDAIAQAGGFGPGADARAAAALNLAAPLTDGAQVTVPDRASGITAPPASGADTSAPSQPSGPIDLDHATLAELDTLPGVGPVTANKIVAARDEAPFGSPDDLLARKLVGPATYEKIKALVTADGR